MFATLRGFLDYKSGLTRYFYPWGSAMNGMTSRQEAVRQIIFNLEIERVVETGTFRGTTAEWFASLGLPIETVEISERYYSFSQRRLKSFGNVELFLDSSVPFLQRRIREQRVRPGLKQLFYLDSHWGEYLPLHEELELIFDHYTQAVVVIDDFQVADDPGYFFERYSEEKQLTLPYLKKAKITEPICFYPSTRSDRETGHRRGWLVATNNNDLASQIDNIHLLRRA